MSIVGISGKINSGKDLSGLILQYFGSEYNKHYTFLDWKNRVENYNSSPNSRVEIKKFADKLKDMVCMLIVCTRKQLEDREFKNKPLGEEWRIWYGRNYKLSSDSNTRGQITGIYSSKEELDLALYTLANKVHITDTVSELLTPRTLLQLLGTECGRRVIHPEIWVNSLMAEYKGIEQPNKPGQERQISFPNWVITDVRFPNEAEAIKRKGGIVLRIERPYSTVAGGGNPANFNKEQFHASETALDDYKGFSHIIQNDGSVEELMEKLRETLKIIV